MNTVVQMSSLEKDSQGDLKDGFIKAHLTLGENLPRKYPYTTVQLQTSTSKVSVS